MITRNTIALKIQEYLKHTLTLEQLVDWSENVIMEENFENKMCRDTVAQLGVADVRAFGLTWEECENILSQLGYKVDLTFKKVA